MAQSGVIRLQVMAFVSFLLISVGTYISILAPEYALVRTQAQLAQSMEVSKSEIADLHASLKTRSWFASSYIVELRDAVLACEFSTKVVEDSFGELQSVSGVQTLQTLLDTKLQSLGAARTVCATASSIRVNQDALRMRATTELTTAQNQFDLARKRNDQFVADLDTAVKARVLTKYTVPLQGVLSASKDTLKKSETNLLRAEELLPDDSIEGKGDPVLAFSFLNELAVDLEKVLQSDQAGMVRIADVLDASAKAPASLTAATVALHESKAIVSKTITQTGFGIALLSAENRLAKAESLYTEGQQAMTVGDAPLAFERAGASKAESVGGVSDATVIVRRAQWVLQSVAKGDAVLQKIALLSSESKGFLETLTRYHASSAWESVAHHQERIASTHTKYMQLLLDVKEKSSHRVQNFVGAEDSMRGADTLFAEAVQLHAAAGSMVAQLESDRRHWSTLASQVSSAIEDEESDVRRYGSYSSSAKRDFERAVDLFAHAQGMATARHYATATVEAEYAEKLASGTGWKARRAYDDYVEEQRREEARQRAAAEEAAAQAARNAYQSSQSDNDSSSSSSNGGGSSSYSSNDGGDWGDSSSSSNDGGDW
jgi:hypothetical protein